MYAAGSEKEKGAGGRLHGGTIAQSFVFCKGGVAGAPDSGVRPPMGKDGFGLACAAIPPAPPSDVFRNRGTRCTPRRGLRPLHPAGGTGVLLWRAPSFSGGTGLAGAVVPPAHPPTFLGTGGHAVPPGGGCALCTLLGGGGELPHLPLRTGGRTRCACWTGGLVVACALLQRGVGLACAVVPPAPPSDVFRNRGTPPVPPAGAAPPAPCLGDGGGVGASGSFLTFRWVRG